MTVIVALAEARFGQEQVPISAIGQVQGGEPGVAQTIAGAAISDLLAGTNACDKLSRADQIIAELGDGADALAAAIGMVAAEKNVNPFNSQTPVVCSDPSLPSTEALRGITPLVDPDFADADIANSLSSQTVTTPLDATNKSILDLMQEAGVANVAGQAPGGAVGAVNPGAATGNADSGMVDQDAGAVDAGNATAVAPIAACNGTAVIGSNQTASNVTNPPVDAGADTGANGTDPASDAATSLDGADFGLCTPTMTFEGGRANRAADEFTFLPADPLVAQGQQEALNPNIITNRICDQLTNVCEANDAAKTACLDAKAQILALGTRDKTTADTWNTLLGFDGAVTNPSGGPAEPPAAARMKAGTKRSARVFIA
ncbi:hypothetical protein EJ05DRAFT_499888 [Pseudovirgaria hyperparasitica]|uniref:Uncharacterized protein n=1 Tax=Pseudovirgaria hyperparasitica TaxID=470096 RepID=A0A6A6W657_9PEZI|nr:uncharacterized protein EJ05DRAFT_499888 [Pseudovirgaria hyperparasitica]KAF2758362.1 hypothetical protein EJ05DRAFT_499888 [Pseudovirgaria hyperparasitica]